MDKIEKLFDALRLAFAEEIAAAKNQGRMEAKTEALDAMASAMGVSLPKKPGRKPKGA
jgi:hypothetical protein